MVRKIEEIAMKRCYRCKEIKPITEFYKNRAKKDGIATPCKSCHREIDKEKWKNNPEKCREAVASFFLRRPFYNWARKSLYSHKKKGVKIELGNKELEQMAINAKFCPLCGCELKLNKENVKSNSPTLDRINNENVIRKDNVMIICQQCNITKGERTLKEFIDYCKLIASLEKMLQKYSCIN